MTCDRSVVYSGYSGSLHQKKNESHDMIEILLKMALYTLNQTDWGGGGDICRLILNKINCITLKIRSKEGFKRKSKNI